MIEYIGYLALIYIAYKIIYWCSIKGPIILTHLVMLHADWTHRND
jgi:hypothetical protein